MLAHGFSPAVAFLCQICRISNSADLPCVSRIRHGERAVSSGSHYFPVYQLINFEIPMHVPMQVESIHFMMEPFNFGILIIRDAFARESTGQRFETTYKIKEITDIMFVQHAYSRASIGQELNESFRSQDFQGFA